MKRTVISILTYRFLKFNECYGVCSMKSKSQFNKTMNVVDVLFLAIGAMLGWGCPFGGMGVYSRFCR